MQKMLASILLTFIFVSCSQATSLRLSLSDNNYKEKVHTFFSDSYLLTRLECKKELMTSEYEMSYLLGVAPNFIFDADTLCIGIDHLRKKAKFSYITFEMIKGAHGVTLKIGGERIWILKALHINGVSVGKQRFYPLYEIANGEVFSYSKHQESLEAIKQTLRVDGYLNADVTSYFNYFHNEKALDVYVTLHLGMLFTIKEVSLFIRHTNVLDDADVSGLIRLIKQKYINTLSDKSYTNEILSSRIKSIKKFLEAKGFASINIELQEEVCHKTGTVNIVFVIDLTKGRSFEFFGNHYFSSSYLTSIITHFGKDAGNLPGEILAQEIFLEYQKKGFWNTTIETYSQDKKDFFVIKEGERAVLEEIIFKGIETYDSKWFIKKFFSGVLLKPFDGEKVKEAVDNVLHWYKQHGFWDVKLIERKYIKHSENNYALQVIIDEGKQRFLSEVKIPGNSDIEQEEPFFINSRGSVPFSAYLLMQQQAALIKKFRSMGFSQVKVSYQLQSLKNGYRIIWDVDQGPYVTFGKTILRGYTKVPFSVLEKKLGYREGDIWDKEKLQNALNELRGLNIFERISLQPIYSPSDPTKRTILLTLQEDDPIEAKLRLGYQQVSKNFAFKKGSSYKIGASGIWKNPFKKADKLTLDINVTRFERAFSGAYQFPIFFGYPYSTIIKGYATKYTQPVSLGVNKTLYEATQQGFLLGINSNKKYIDKGCNIGFEWMETKNISPDLAKAINFETDLIDQKIPYFFIEPSIFIDLLNDKLNPTKGFFALASLKGMFPLESRSSYFLKLLVEEGIFIPLGPLTFASRVRFGHIFRKTFNAIMPPERFYLGGANSLRGYQTDKCPPLGTFVDDSGITQWVPKGGKSMLNINLEMRFPLSLQSLYGVFFQDFGVLVEDVHTLLNRKKPLAATGFGLRYITPLGPIRFDIGWKWHKQTEQENSYAWFLTFGHAF